MKRNNLTTAVIAGLAGVAGFAGVSNAVQLSADGVGQVLLYSYYTVNADQQTNFSVVNTTGAAKAVKVRFLEAYNSREVLDFNLFLSEYDVWTASVAEHAAGGAAIHTADESCTVGRIFGAGQVPFKTVEFSGSKTDGGPQGVDRTREGHFEMIEMATIPTDSPTGVVITHGPGMNCGLVTTRIGAGEADLLPPSGGLFGNAAIVNVGEGTMYSYAADAIDGFSARTLYTGAGLVTPSLADANTSGPNATAYVFLPGGQLISATYPGGQNIDAVSAVFASTNVYNEWINDPAVGADSEWIINFPTKRYYVDPPIVGTSAIAPFTETFTAGESCDEVGASLWDREEYEKLGEAGCVFSPCEIDEVASLCYETQVITFGQDGGSASDVLGSSLSLNIDLVEPGASLPFADAGWLDLSFPGRVMRADINGNQFHGLPVNGHLVQRFINANANPGMLSNYSGMFRHRTERSCTNVEGADGLCS